MVKMVDRRIVLVLLLCIIADCVISTTFGPESTTKTPSSNFTLGPVCRDPKQQLLNTVVNTGASSSFFNQPDTIGVKWEIYPSFDPNSSPNPPYTMADGGIAQYNDSYTVTPTQLQILRANIYNQGSDPYSTSGLYVVTYKTDGCQALANLIVVDAGPTCLCNEAGSDKGALSCEIIYGVNNKLPNRATMTWTADSGGTIASYTYPHNTEERSNCVISTFTYQITSSDAASYTCRVTFTPPNATNPNMASNAPNFTASCTVPNCVKTTATTTIGPESTTNTQTGTFPPTTEIATTTGCPKDLMNIVVYEGSVAEFENADDGKPVKWHFSSSSDPENNLIDITDYDNKVNPMFVGVYNVTRTKLTILSATVAPQGSNRYSTAGVYFLTYQSTGCQTAANLIVIQSRPMCDRNENDPNKAKLSCNISYAESGRQPSYPKMTWTTGGVVIPSDQPTTQKYAYVNGSLSQIPVNKTAPSYYQCQVTFNPPAPVSFPIPFLAQNAPSYADSCTVASGTFPPTTEIATTTADTVPPTTTTGVANNIADTVPPTTTTGVATTTGVCVDSPSCSSKWSDRKVFCPYVQEFSNDCPTFCKVPGCV